MGLKLKTIIKRLLDVLMTIGLLFATGYQFWGEAAHEWIGAGMLLLFIVHHVLNINWYKRLFKGRYTPVRIFQLCINTLTFVAMLMLMYSGIVLSRHVFAFLPIESGLAVARRLHILGSYWGFVLMSLHLGLHWNMVLGIVRKKAEPKRLHKVCSVVCFIAGLLIAGYGVSVFVKRDFLTYMLLKSEFVFLDFSEPIVLFYIDALALMGLCIFFTHYISKLCRSLYKWTRGTQKKRFTAMLLCICIAFSITACSVDNGLLPYPLPSQDNHTAIPGQVLGTEAPLHTNTDIAGSDFSVILEAVK